MPDYFCHESSYIDDGAEIGAGTKIWHFSHIQKAKIGERCIFGQNVNVADGVMIGNNVKVQNNVSIYTGTVIEDDVFLGPSCVLTNVTNPRSQVNRHSLYEKTLIRRGATLGANCTIVCGVTLGRYCFIAAGSVVTKDVPDYALMVGNPARQKGWMSRHGHHLRPEAGEQGAEDRGQKTEVRGQRSEVSLRQCTFICPESGYRYQLTSEDRGQRTENRGQRTEDRNQKLDGRVLTSDFRPLTSDALHCLDLDEEAPLPPELTKGTKTYDELKR